jgi:hypothetical protein
MALITTDPDAPLERNQKLIYSIFWLIMLVVVSYPLAWFLVWFWVLFMPFEYVFDPVRQMNELLEKFVTWPRMIGKAFFMSEEEFPNPVQQMPSDAVGLAVPEMSVTMYSIIWLIMLLLLSWPLSWFLVWFWVLLMPLEYILEPIRQFNELLEKLVTWPRIVGKAIWKGEAEFPNPLQQTPSEALLHSGGDASGPHVVEEHGHPETTYTLC